MRVKFGSSPSDQRFTIKKVQSSVKAKAPEEGKTSAHCVFFGPSLRLWRLGGLNFRSKVLSLSKNLNFVHGFHVKMAEILWSPQQTLVKKPNYRLKTEL